jgi:hypothetical protein
MAGSRFCACPEGDSPSAKRQYDAILTGCIPAVVSNEAIFAYTDENMGAGGAILPFPSRLRWACSSRVSPT